MNGLRRPFLQSYRINALRAIGGVVVCTLAVISPPHASPFVNLMFDAFGTLAIFVVVPGASSILADAKTRNLSPSAHIQSPAIHSMSSAGDVTVTPFEEGLR